MTRSFRALLLVLTLIGGMTLAGGVRASSGALTYEEARAIICQPSLSWDCGTMLAISWRESRWTPSAVNYDCGSDGTYRLTCFGLLQVLSPCECGLLDPYQNVASAYDKYLNGGVSVHWRATE